MSSKDRKTGTTKAGTAASETLNEKILNPERYRLIFESSNVGIVSTTLNGDILEANPAFCRLLGYSREEIIQKNITRLTHSADVPANLVIRKQVTAGEKTSEIIEKRYICKNGELVWARLVGSPIYNEAGEVVNLFAMVEDITVRKAAEAERKRMLSEIAASEQRLNYITRASLDLIWDWNLETRQVWWGDGLETLFGFNAEMMGSDETFWLQRTHPDDLPKLQAAIDSVLQGKAASWDLILRIRKLNDKYTHIEERAFAITDNSGQVVRIVAGVTDVSSRMELEERLRQSQRLEALGQLTGGVAHDFNNLLTVMLGNAELLAEGLHSEPAKQELAKAIIRSGLQGADLTHRLLAFARKQALEPKNISLNQLIENMSKILERTLGEQIALKIHDDQSLWLCQVDPNQMESALLNLALNARDAMPDGGDLIIETSNCRLDSEYVETRFELKPGEYVCLAISDSGRGIPPENLEKVLEPFFTTKEKGKGTGLGLSTIFGFVKQSQGHLNIYSEAGHGTTVKIYVPRSAIGEVQRVERVDKQQKIRKGKELVLLVEDDELVRQYAEIQVKSLGYRVITAANGREALECLKAHPDIDLMFTDVIMPGGLNGRQLADAALKFRPELKILFTSGYTENSILNNGRLEADVHLLGKPYQRHELASKLRLILDT